MAKWTLPDISGSQDGTPSLDGPPSGEMDMARAFGTHLETRLLPLLREVERGRLRALSAQKGRFWGAAILLALCVIGAGAGLSRIASDNDDTNRIVLWTSAVMIAPILLWVRGSKSKYKSPRRQRLAPEILKLLGKVRYEADGKLDEKVIIASHMVGHYSSYSGRDRVTGQRKGHEFGFGHAEFRYREGEKVTTMFTGYMVLISVRQPLEGLTMMVTGPGGKSNRLAEMKELFPELADVPFYNAAIEGTFNVRSTEEREARRLITPNFARTVRGLATLLDAKSIAIALRDDHVVIRLETDMVLLAEEGLDTSAMVTEDIPKFLAATNGVLAILDTIADAER